NQWAGGARILETLQETLQGMRIVKAFTLEDAVRARFQSHVADVERESNKMARVSQRVHPFTEGLGGLAAMLIMIYAGYATIYGGATPAPSSPSCSPRCCPLNPPPSLSHAHPNSIHNPPPRARR